MKVAVPCDTPFGLNAQRSGHFGHCAFFTVATIEGNEVTDVQVVPNVDHDEVGCGGVIDFALSLGIDAIIAAGMGVPPPADNVLLRPGQAVLQPGQRLGLRRGIDTGHRLLVHVMHVAPAVNQPRADEQLPHRIPQVRQLQGTQQPGLVLCHGR